MPRIKLYASKKWMHMQYVVNKLTPQQIADKANTDLVTVYRWLKKFGYK